MISQLKLTIYSKGEEMSSNKNPNGTMAFLLILYGSSQGQFEHNLKLAFPFSLYSLYSLSPFSFSLSVQKQHSLSNSDLLLMIITASKILLQLPLKPLFVFAIFHRSGIAGYHLYILSRCKCIIPSKPKHTPRF